MKEIGGYFGLEICNQREYYEDLVAVNSARNALTYLIRAKKIKKIYLPYFLCDSVSNACERESCDYDYYSINEEFFPKFDKILLENEFLYIVNYYGQLTNDKIHLLRTKFKNIIVDNVQAFFQRPIEGVDTIYSCRKFFGVPDGGYLHTDVHLREPLEVDESRTRMVHILGRFEEGASAFYNDFQKNDEAFTELHLKWMSALTHNLLRAINYEEVRLKRNENYRVLSTQLNKVNRLNLMDIDGPYSYPFYCSNGMEIKRKLAKKKIYVPTLWPNVLKMEMCLDREFAENILPIPCDQRYDKKDMQRIVEELLCLS